MAFTNNIGTLLKENETEEDLIFTFPSSDSVGNFLQVQTISGTVEVKGTGKVFGENSNYIPLSEGQEITLAAIGNVNPLGVNSIKLAPGAIVTFITYD